MDIISIFVQLAKTAYPNPDTEQLIANLPQNILQAFHRNDGECIKNQLSDSDYEPNESHVVSFNFK